MVNSNSQSVSEAGFFLAAMPEPASLLRVSSRFDFWSFMIPTKDEFDDWNVTPQQCLHCDGLLTYPCILIGPPVQRGIHPECVAAFLEPLVSDMSAISKLYPCVI